MPGAPSGQSAAEAEFERVKDSPVELRMFLQRFPKGGDLHNHLSGAIYAEDFIAWAEADGLCLDVESMTATTPPCDKEAGRPSFTEAFENDTVTRDAVIDGWSMRNYVPGISAASGHDQFFGTFSRFDEAERDDSMLAEVVWHAADQKIGYLELMVSPEMGSAMQLGMQTGGQKNFAAHYDALMAAGIEDLVADASARLDRIEEGVRQRFGCPSSEDPACKVEVRFLAQVIRTVPADAVFAQSLLSFLLVEQDPRVVGLNFVAPEDDHLALATYDIQMQQLGYLAEWRGPVPVALHAGELTLGLVHPRHLRDHIRQAIEVAGASRIGHGVDIAYERDAERLLMAMAEKPVTVEINLTSNDTILGVEGEEHPFDTYRAYGVPLTLSTDDEGVSRGDLTHEYQRAVETYDLSYADLLTFSRNALTYSFADGKSLWQDPARGVPVRACRNQRLGGSEPAEDCAAFLDASKKARLQWRLEAELADFERDRADLRRARGMGEL